MNADEFVAVINPLLEALRDFERPDPRTVRLFEDNLEAIKNAVYAMKSQLDAQTFSELQEAWGDYANIPVGELVPHSPAKTEDILINLLEHMTLVATGGTRV